MSLNNLLLLLLFAFVSGSYAQLLRKPSSNITTNWDTLTNITNGIVSTNVVPYDANATDYYLGYHDSDFSRPFAKYFNVEVADISDELQKGLSASPHAAELAYGPFEAKKYMLEPGYLQLENGWSTLADGGFMLAIRTDMGNVTGAMYEWWFGWHLVDPARYKLWHPHAHRYLWRYPNNLDIDPSAPLTSRYVGTYSFINEYIGNDAVQLSLNFIDPSTVLGLDKRQWDLAGIETIVAGHGQSFVHTTNITGNTYLVHQLRRKPGRRGEYELRSRFFFPSADAQFARELIVHCNTEMQHLSTFLPQLYEEFKDTI